MSRLHTLFLDPRALTAPGTEEVEFGPANLTRFVQGNGFDVGGIYGEGPFHAYAVRYFTNGESSGSTLALTLDHVTFKALDTLFVTLDDLIVDSDIVARLERRNLLLFRQLLMYKGYRSIHDFKI